MIIVRAYIRSMKANSMTTKEAKYMYSKLPNRRVTREGEANAWMMMRLIGTMETNVSTRTRTTRGKERMRRPTAMMKTYNEDGERRERVYREFRGRE